MPILASEIQFFKSNFTGSDTITSLGGAITANQLTSGLLNDLWDDVTATESSTGDTEYRCIYVQNKNLTLTLQTAGVYIDTNSPNPNVTCAIGLDPAGLNGVATTVADESTPPAGVSFTTPDSGSPLTIGNMAPDDFQAIWIRRVVTAGAPASAADGPTLACSGVSDP